MSQATLCGDDKGGSSSPAKLLLSPGSPKKSYNVDLALALDTATLNKPTIKN